MNRQTREQDVSGEGAIAHGDQRQQHDAVAAQTIDQIRFVGPAERVDVDGADGFVVEGCLRPDEHVRQ